MMMTTTILIIIAYKYVSVTVLDSKTSRRVAVKYKNNGQECSVSLLT